MRLACFSPGEHGSAPKGHEIQVTPQRYKPPLISLYSEGKGGRLNKTHFFYPAGSIKKGLHSAKGLEEPVICVF
jgi:hypothetical protein